MLIYSDDWTAPVRMVQISPSDETGIQYVMHIHYIIYIGAMVVEFYGFMW